MATQKAPRSHTEKVRLVESKWSKELAKAGWTALPNIILEKQAALGLRPLDVNILLQIGKYWWEADSAPFPSIETIANSIGVMPRTIQRRITAMVEAKLIERHSRFYPRGGQKSNSYTFEGLITRCKPFAEEVARERERRKSAQRARTKQKTPLTVVK